MKISFNCLTKDGPRLEGTPSGALISLILLFALSLSALSEPLVMGYERFHSDKPSKEGGALLYSELGCASCHGGSPIDAARKGPNIANLRQRVDRDWLVDFLKDPEAGREGTTMPKMTHALADKEIEAIVAYLGTVGKGLRFVKSRHANAERGSAIYHEIGCVACHEPTPDFISPNRKEIEDQLTPSVRFPDFKKKTSLAALDHFLRNSSAYRSDGRMPHFTLEGQKSMDVAAHLLDFQASDPGKAEKLKPWPKARIEQVNKGRQLVQTLNCASCHELPGIKPDVIKALPGKLKKKGDHCFTEKAVPGLPHYTLSDLQKKSLELYLDKPKLSAEAQLHATLAAMNCYACHSRSGVGGPTAARDAWFIGDKGLGDSGRIPPPLTGIGFKLQPKWMEGVLSGDPKMKVRPYLKTQMPSYKEHSKLLTSMFQKVDKKTATFLIDHSAKSLEAGRKLVGTQGGVNCITCHNWGSHTSLGIQALDISSLHKRLKPEWFKEYMIDPANYRPGTLMPSLWPNGKSAIPDMLDGNADKQIAAIWAFMEKGKGIPEGFPERSKGQFEIVPQDRPVIQRTFLKDVGVKAIIVGFPEKIHIAYDASSGRPALVWRGRFFDAYNTWFSRFAPFEKPLSEKVYSFETPKQKGRFRGYRVDDTGNPIFLQELDGRVVNEKFSVLKGKLIRELSWETGSAPVVAHPKGVKFEKQEKANHITIIYSWN